MRSDVEYLDAWLVGVGQSDEEIRKDPSHRVLRLYRHNQLASINLNELEARLDRRLLEAGVWLACDWCNGLIGREAVLSANDGGLFHEGCYGFALGVALASREIARNLTSG